MLLWILGVILAVLIQCIVATKQIQYFKCDPIFSSKIIAKKLYSSKNFNNCYLDYSTAISKVLL